MTNEQLKTLLTRYRTKEKLLRRATEASAIIAFLIVIFKNEIIGFIGKELSGEVFLSAIPEKGKSRVERDITMDSEAFNDRFYVTAKVPEEAFYILTPHMMEYILEMADKAGGPVYMAFLRSGKVQIAVNNNRDIFELDDAKADYDTLHQKFLGELKWFTDMIDTLRVEDTLYQKEANV